MIQIFKKTNIDFMKYKFIAFGVSGAIIVAGLANIFFGKGLKPGVDFSGGTLIRVLFKSPLPVSDVRQALTEQGLGNSIIQEVEKAQREYIIRTAGLSAGDIQADQDLEAHAILANRIIETLKNAEDKAAVERGLLDFNNAGVKEIAAVLQPAYPDEAASLAERIINFRVEKGIIEDFGILREAGISDEVISVLKDRTFLGSLTVLSRDTVGPQVGKDLRRKATQATVWALLGMLVYIAARFKLAYGVAAILTLTHDVLFTLSVFSFTNREVNLPVIAAVLTIVGYSINDTIVIFDRVRDNIKLMRKSPFEGILNASINQTLSRTVITSGTVFLTVIALYLFGGQVINDFAFTMLIGVITGTYSTIYQSCPIVYFWQKIFGTGRRVRR
ncbi:MAG: protein translocase subunit SecF [Candidatus Aminicenantes bacterium]|nr:protein translocase subunit SecF [Candidatus Aminicenantes bacterium]